ncbi:MAG: DUF2264 domain-containing protein [Defluviitaleaceae bacterium]|nr:DUF2264 domain-containing protein [Defluviitaleaceae bacterium]
MVDLGSLANLANAANLGDFENVGRIASRADFLRHLLKMSTPVLNAAAAGELRKTMKVEQHPNANRERFARLEAVARLLNGISAWLELELDNPEEKAVQQDLAAKAVLAIQHQVDPKSDDFTDYEKHGGKFSQILVDTALLAQALLRAPSLLSRLPPAATDNLLKLLQAARTMEPVMNNWLLFSTEVELLHQKITGSCNENLITEYFNTVNGWYFGDGWYGDGPKFATDYYNSLIIHPMMLDICDTTPHLVPEKLRAEILERAQRFAEILENLVAPDGTYIATGRSLAYRCGVFHLLAQLTLQNRLSAKISPATAREVLYSVASKTLTEQSYRTDGFLNIGICNHDLSQGQTYICTGSLYLAAAVFLILGIPEKGGFWTQSAPPWTQLRVWGDL